MGARAGRLGDASEWRHAKKTVVRAMMVQLPPPVLLLVFRGFPGHVASRVPRPLVLWAASRKGRERERERCGSGGGGGGGGVNQYEQRDGATAADCRTTCPRGRLLCVSGWGRGHNCGLD